MRGVRIALAGGAVAVLVALAVVLSRSDYRQSGSNYVPESGEAVTIPGTGEHCQAGQVVPEDTAGLRLLIGTYERPAPELAVEVSASGSEVTSGARAAGGREGRVRIGLEPVEETTGGARVCVRVRVRAEPGRRTVLYGSGELVRLEWLREGPESWLGLAPAVAERFGLGKPNPFGSLLLPLMALALVAAWVAAARLVAREEQG